MEASKKCFKCGEIKPLSHFYKHPMMADGHVNKCKECNKLDVRQNREKKVEYYREYDRQRGNRQTLDDLQRYREQNPKKYAAHSAVGNAIRKGLLIPKPCEICGEVEVHGHHDDYDFPLTVRWLCAPHHFEWHGLNGEGANAH